MHKMHFFNQHVSNLPLSRLGFGGASISGEGKGYGFGDLSEKSAIELVKTCYDRGIRVFDTAPIYGFGESEKRLGKALVGLREKAFIISKSGVDWHDNGRVNMSNDPVIAQKQLEQSLQRLQTDYIDLYMVHWPDTKFPIEKTLEVYVKAKEKGMIRGIGLCNTDEKELKKAQAVCDIVALQSEVNSFQNQLQTLGHETFYSMGWGTFDKGILSGRVSKERVFDETDCRSWAPWWKKSDWKKKVDKAQRLQDFLVARGHSLVEFSLAYTLNYSNVNTALCGVRSIEQLSSLLDAYQNLPGDELVTEGLQYV